MKSVCRFGMTLFVPVSNLCVCVRHRELSRYQILGNTEVRECGKTELKSRAKIKECNGNNTSILNRQVFKYFDL